MKSYMCCLPSLATNLLVIHIGWKTKLNMPIYCEFLVEGNLLGSKM